MSSIILTELDNFFAEKLLGAEASEETTLSLARLMAMSRQGHLCATLSDLSFPPPASLLEEGTHLFPTAPIVWDAERYYLQRNWVYETYLLQETKRLRAQPLPSWIVRSQWEGKLLDSALLPAQREAICSALSHSFSIICGGPGSGKTYTASHLVTLLAACKGRSLRVAIAAPTGKAAFHLHAAIQKRSPVGIDAEVTTLHRLLHLQPGEERLFSRRILDADLVLVDEASLIDISLMAHLFESIGEETLLVLIGDPNQLPPVTGGSLFCAMAELFGSFLERSLRVEAKEVGELISAVQEGNLPLFLSYPKLYPLEELPHQEIFFANDIPDPKVALDFYERHRFLSAVRQGPYGVDEINAFFWKKIIATRSAWAVPILATANDPWRGIYNGMNGVLVGKASESAVAWFPDLATGKLSPFSPPPPYELAFCLSVHKSQGCEYEEVIAFFPSGSEFFGKEGLYTAITRAKRSVQLFGEPEIFAEMLKKSARAISGFTDRFRCG